MSTKNVATVGNIIPSDTNVLTSKSIESSEAQNLSTNSTLSKTFSFTPAFDLKQSTMLPSKDDTSLSSRKFIFVSPIQQKEYHADIDKVTNIIRSITISDRKSMIYYLTSNIIIQKVYYIGSVREN